MARFFDLVGTHWLTITLVVVAGLSVVFGLRRRRSQGSIPTIAVLGLLLSGGYLLGGLLLASTKLSLLDRAVTAPDLLLGMAFLGFVLAGTLLVFIRAWSPLVGFILAGLAATGLGAASFKSVAGGGAEVARVIRWVEFVRPEWLALLILVPLVYLVSRNSLSGMSATRKWLAITARILGVACLALALAEPRIRRPSDRLTVLYVVDRSFSVPQDLDPDRPPAEAVDRRWERVRSFIEQSVARRGVDKRNDQAGLILFGRRPRLALPPAAVDRMPIDERMAGPIDGNYTDIAAAIKLALASFPEGTGRRIVLVSDGNENIGLAEDQANLARQNDVQIDTIALAPGFKNENEVLVQAVEAPTVTAQGQRLPIRVLIRNATSDRIVVGRLEVFKSSTGENKTIEIESSPQVVEDGPPPKVRLLPGLNVFRFRDRIDPQGDSAFAYRATFTPVESRPLAGGVAQSGLPGDRTANNRAAAAVVSRGQRRVLFLDESGPGGASPHEFLLLALRRARIRVDRLAADRLPTEKGDLGIFLSNYDSVVLANVPAERFSSDQMEILRTSVYDQGAGLVMIGGPDSFGPGGYQSTPIEAALPVDCEIKALKAAGKGGLVLIMHASEMADGNKWQKEIAKLAIDRLGPADMVGVAQYGFGGNGVNWHIPFQEIGEDKGRLKAKVDSMMPGDMPDFDPFLRAAVDTLSDPKHNLSVRHCILISDGDPNYSGPGLKAVREMAENAITCTTVGVATHGGAEKSRMKQIAEGTKDGNGKPGNFYDVTDPSKLPGIYIKESRRVSQSFIFDKLFEPKIIGGGGTSDVLAPGLPNPLPPLHGFVRTTMKENVLAGMSIEGPTVFDQRFPVLASWRYGLGKAVAFTSDARTQPGLPKQWWDREWVGSEMYQKFWEQVINWSMREAERGRLTLVTEYRDGRVRVIADVRDDKEKPVGGLALKGSVTPPNSPPPGEKAPQVEFKPKGGGIYEAEFPAEEAGSYFVNVQALQPERDAAGNLILDPNGNPKLTAFDAARAGVTVPYSPEFSDLESNTPLLRRLAEMTGGEFHTEADEDFQSMLKSGTIFRDAPTSTRSLLPFWYWLVFAAAVLLLFDVALRRIAIEWSEVERAVQRFWSGLRAKPVEVDDSVGLDRLLQRKASVGATIDRSRATRRFEAPGTAPAEPAPQGADDYASRLPSGPSTPIAPTPEAPRSGSASEEEDTFAKLRKAKQRARHQQKRDDETE